ncbi:hypothetical protein [Maricaulis sp.]|uniref:hypothetical protein n=1 Tax=Maricaulis sp. TaxID=1486257 RepID=UPI00262F5276|nr:hypothetical protein [Maricaulis sp.]
MEQLLNPAGGRYGLIVHIGCGEDAGRFWEERADDLVLVEPDPDRALAVRDWVERSGKGTFVQAAVAEGAGEAAFLRTSFSDMNSLRAMTGAMTLFPGLQSLESVPVKTIPPRGVLAGRDLERIAGATALVVDAPSEACLVLADLDDAELLDFFDDIVVHVPESPLHQGGADRAALEGWLNQTERRIEWEANPSDPELRYGRIRRDWVARNKRQERQIADLKRALEGMRSERDGFKDELEALRKEIGTCKQARDKAAQDAKANLDALEAKRQQQEALKQELESVREARAKAAEEAQAAIDTLEGMRSERDGFKDELEALRKEIVTCKQARDKAAQDAKANLDALEEMRRQRDSLKIELTAAQARADEQSQAVQRLGSELEGLRDDNRLSLRIQRIAQADLADLQERHSALADEKRQLENFLDELAHKVMLASSTEDRAVSDTRAKKTGSASRTSARRTTKAATKRQAKPS